MRESLLGLKDQNLGGGGGGEWGRAGELGVVLLESIID